MLVRVRSPDFRPRHRGGGPGLAVCAPPASQWAGDSSRLRHCPCDPGEGTPQLCISVPPFYEWDMAGG